MIKKIVFISTSNSSINVFLKKLISSLINQKIQVSVITNSIPVNKNRIKNVKYYKINLHRKINFIYDLISLILFFKLLFILKPDLSVSITPKAGLINSIVTKIFKTKSIHFFTGQVWYNKKNFYRFFLKFLDLLTFKLISYPFADSISQINFLKSEGFLSKNITLINNGSICGVDTIKFKKSDNYNKLLRQQLSIDTYSTVIGYIGRLSNEKGTILLLNAFKKLCSNNNNLTLLLVGLDEGSILDLVSKNFSDLNIKYFNFTNEPENYYKIIDIFCIPSYREGFGLSAIEASASNVPVVASKIVGLEDSIKDGISGILFENGNLHDLINKLESLIASPDLSKSLGLNGRKRVLKYFKEKEVINFLSKSIIKIIN
jgi:glycosyltransferase involved in cell wall biosynthesis